jgi:hypothetical protein
MGLWLKCPQCQTANPLELVACANCSASLDKLPAAQRVYILDKAAPPVPKAAAPKAAAEAEAPSGTPEDSPPAKRTKGAKTRKKKQ